MLLYWKKYKIRMVILLIMLMMVTIGLYVFKPLKPVNKTISIQGNCTVFVTKKGERTVYVDHLCRRLTRAAKRRRNLNKLYLPVSQKKHLILCQK
jgi:hypothetical protein